MTLDTKSTQNFFIQKYYKDMFYLEDTLLM